MLKNPLLSSAAAAFAAAGLFFSLTARGDVVRVYHIGNSVTDMISYPGLKKMADGAGDNYDFGRHTIPGTPLEGIWKLTDRGGTQQPYGYWPEALADYTWDALTLQPFDRDLYHDPESPLIGDVESAGNFIRYTLDHLAEGAEVPNFYVYSTWPTRTAIRDDQGNVTGYEDFDFQGLWDRPYTRIWDHSHKTRDFFQQLRVELQGEFPDVADNFLIVPVGDVLYALDQKMEAGEISGYTDIEQIYSDSIHFTAEGKFIVGTVFYATLFGKDPAGLDSSVYGFDDEDFAAAVQETAWEVVSTHPFAGVVPEPTAGAMLLLPAFALLRRRRQG